MSLTLTSGEANRIRDLVRDSERIVITTHQSPDGDAMGSSLALQHYLHMVGIKSHVVVPDHIPSFLQWLPGADKVIVFSEHKEKAKKAIALADLIFSLDYNQLYRTGKEMEEVLEKSKASFILVDHHHDPGDFAGIVYSDTRSCSTAQMVFKMIEALGDRDKIDIPTAECIYCGLVTDSGSFRFPSVTPETHHIAADLIARGMDHARIHREIYDNNILDRIRLVGYALSEKLEVIKECSVAIIALTGEELQRFNYRPGDTEGLVNQALSVQGVKLAAFFREGNNEIKVSFRSTGLFDVNRYARKSWKGGGHSNAAGGNSNESLGEALSRFKQEVHTLCAEINQS